MGYGLAGRVFHGPLLAATPGLRVAAIVTANAERQAAAMRDFPEALIMSRAEELWSRRDLADLVVVATATGSHVAVATAAVDAGAAAVVVEKPLAASAPEAAALVEHATRREVLIAPFLNRRWDSDHLTLTGLLAAETLGTVYRYESRFERWRPTPAPQTWRDRPEPEGGGVLLDLGVHLVDQAMTLFGPVDRVFAEVLSRRGGADDDVFLALHHRSGVSSHLWASALAAARGPRLRVLGSRAAYVVDELDGQEDSLRDGHRPDGAGFGEEAAARWGRLVRGAEGEPVPSVAGRWLDFYLGMRDCLRDGTAPPVAAEDAVDGLVVIDAARESARRSTVVPIIAE